MNDINKLKEKIIRETPLLSRYMGKIIRVNVKGYAATDGDKIYIYDDFENLDGICKVYILYHELYHILFRHTLFMNDIEESLKKFANIAMDKSVNSWLIDESFNFRFMKSIMLPEQFIRGLILPEGDEEWGADWLYYLKNIRKSKHASIETELDVLQEEYINKPKNDTFLNDVFRITPNSLPNYIIAIIGKTKSNINWKNILRRYLNENLIRDREEMRGRIDIRKIARYSSFGDFIFFKNFYPKLRIGIIVDVSGSVKDFVDRLVCEASNVIRECGSSTLILWDEKERKRFENIKQIDRIEINGFGWTDMKGAIETVYKEKNYDVIICITDGESEFPDFDFSLYKKLIIVVFNNEDFVSRFRHIKVKI